MDDINIEEYEDAILMVTGRPEWPILVKGLLAEIHFAQQNVFLKNNWEEVVDERGFCRGLAYVATLREQVIANKRERENADV